MLVDTGSTFIVPPQSLIEKIEVFRLPFKTKASLVSGQEIAADTTVVEVEVEGRRVPAIVLILKAKKSLLGAEALEAMGFKADPTAGRLEATRG